MRRTRMFGVTALLTLGLMVPAAAQASENQLTMSAKITSFAAQDGRLIARGVITGTLRNGNAVTRDRSQIRFKVSQRRQGRRCDILTLNLQQLFLELLGARVETSAINLELYARSGLGVPRGSARPPTGRTKGTRSVPE